MQGWLSKQPEKVGFSRHTLLSKYASSEIFVKKNGAE